MYNLLKIKRLESRHKTYMFGVVKHICFTLPKLNFGLATNP